MGLEMTGWTVWTMGFFTSFRMTGGGVLLDCFVATAPRNDGREGYCAVRLRAMTGERRVGGVTRDDGYLFLNLFMIS